MNCHDAKERLLDLVYAEGAESPDATPADLEAHLAACEACRNELAALGEARAMLGGVAGPERPELPAAAVLLAAGRHAEREGKGWRRAALAAAALAATLLVGWTAGLRVETSAGGIALVWGNRQQPTTASSANPQGPQQVVASATDDPWPLIRRLQQRLDHQEKVLGLISADAVASEGRTSEQLSDLMKELRELRSSEELHRLRLAVVTSDVKQLNSWAARLASTSPASPVRGGEVDVPNE
ncbi:MAG: zf-HC2 domain-containing protein [Planctomycetia bacterium]|nr:zf-HC2 domain-containing protein [Planctomycetia bacterium]